MPRGERLVAVAVSDRTREGRLADRTAGRPPVEHPTEVVLRTAAPVTGTAPAQVSPGCARGVVMAPA